MSDGRGKDYQDRIFIWRNKRYEMARKGSNKGSGEGKLFEAMIAKHPEFDNLCFDIEDERITLILKGTDKLIQYEILPVPHKALTFEISDRPVSVNQARTREGDL